MKILSKSNNSTANSWMEVLKKTAFAVSLSLAAIQAHAVIDSPGSPTSINTTDIIQSVMDNMNTPESFSMLGINTTKAPSQVMDYHINRLNIQNSIQAKESMEALIVFVSNVESSQDQYAENPNSSATSFFQFLTGNGTSDKNSSLVTAINRLEKAVPSLPYELQALKDNPTSEQLMETPYELQASLFIANIMETKMNNTSGYGDKLLKSYLSKNTPISQKLKDAFDIYKYGHHTNLTEKAINNVHSKIQSLKSKLTQTQKVQQTQAI